MKQLYSEEEEKRELASMNRQIAYFRRIARKWEEEITDNLRQTSAQHVAAAAIYNSQIEKLKSAQLLMNHGRYWSAHAILRMMFDATVSLLAIVYRIDNVRKNRRAQGYLAHGNYKLAERIRKMPPDPEFPIDPAERRAILRRGRAAERRWGFDKKGNWHCCNTFTELINKVSEAVADGRIPSHAMPWDLAFARTWQWEFASEFVHSQAVAVTMFEQKRANGGLAIQEIQAYSAGIVMECLYLAVFSFCAVADLMGIWEDVNQELVGSGPR